MKRFRRRWQLNKVRQGDGRALAEYRFWQLFTRSLFYLTVADATGTRHIYAVDVRHMVDAKPKKEHEEGKGKSPAALYRDGAQIARSNVPTTFRVPGGVIEVATTPFGCKRMHYVTGDGTAHPLDPDPRSQEGRRARFDQRFPRSSAVAGTLSFVVLLIALVFSTVQLLETVTQAEPVAEQFGTFTSPVRLSGWANTTLIVAGIIAGYERAARLRYHWLLDSAAT